MNNGLRLDAGMIVHGRCVESVLLPADFDEVSRCLRDAAAHGHAVLPAGLGRRLSWGRPPERCDVVVSTRRLDRIRAYEPDDMTLVVESGVTLTQIADLLRPHGQRLPMDPPFPDETTVGGLIATDVFGPMRPAHGKVRDALIGVRAMLADGTLVKGGGRVVKNVAGYDLMKLLCGSFGSLAVILEACFRLRPLPQMLRASIWRGTDLASAFAAAAALRTLSFTPAMARVVAAETEVAGIGRGPSLVLGLEGSEAEVDAQTRAIGAALPPAEMEGCRAEAAAAVVAAARDLQAWDCDADDAVGVRLSLRPGDLAQAVVGASAVVRAAGLSLHLAADPAAGICYLRLGGGDDSAIIDTIAAMRTRARACGGAVVVEDLPPHLADRIDPWGDVVALDALELMRGIKAALDPQRRLSPGRFVGGI